MSRIEELEKRLAADPNSRMFVQLAEEYRKAGLLEQAIEVCEEGIQKHPQYASARVALGRALLEAESFDRASEEFETVLKQVPDNILANKFLGETYHRLGRHDEAIQKYQVAQALAPEDLEIGERIEAVRSEMTSRSPSAGPAAGEPAAPEPPPPPPAAPAPSPAPPRAAPPPPVPETPPPAPVAAPEIQEPPPPVVTEATADALEEPEPPAAPTGGGPPARDDDLAPIPLVDVDEPMILEDRFADPAASAPPVPPAPPETPSPPPQEDVVEPFVEPLIEPYAEPFAPPENAVETAPSPSQADVETKTLAELYASQGHLAQAIEVYEKLVARAPQEPAYRNRLEELKRQAGPTEPPAAAPASAPAPAPESESESESESEPAAARESSPDATERTIDALNGWLRAIKESREG